ncbi:GDSL-type esterase/lipase family protein [Cellulosilyticum ruminicola]|uniref:GDSL-type esterase/lipase family protein n=1 Tax=Cellulosilyticum ruminicola TaxID=425254 RepID=UPI0006D019FF|nr:GDSL-type esterase/lipase family protein [Cellulosilyticum ruminicola]
MHLGTNDCWQNVKISEIMKAYTKLVGQMRENNPNIIIVVAQIIPLHPDDKINYAANVNALNKELPGWAAELTTKASPIYVCDQYTGFDVDVDTYDGAHPSQTGSQKICDNWYKALVPILSGNVPEPTEIPKPTQTPEPTEIPKPTSVTAGLVLEATTSNWVVAIQWQLGLRMILIKLLQIGH